MHRGVGTWNVTEQGNHRSEKQLCYRDRVARWSVDHGYPERCCRVEGDVVDSYTSPSHDFQPAGSLEQVGGDPSRTPADDGIVVGNPIEQLFLW